MAVFRDLKVCFMHYLSPLAVYGIPRSGFSLALSILWKLIKFDSEQITNISNLNSKLGGFLFNNFVDEIAKSTGIDIDFSGEFSSLTGGPKFINNHLHVRKYIGIKDQGDITLSVQLPVKFCSLIPIYHSHNCDDSLSYITSKLFTYRHPCGIFESSINSFNALTSSYLQTVASSKQRDEEYMRRQIALYKISSPTIRQGLLNHLNSSMDSFNKNYLYYKDTLNCISWEGVINSQMNSINALKNCLSKININRAFDEIVAVIDDLKYQNLLYFHKHNFRPGHALPLGWLPELPSSIVRDICSLDASLEYLKTHSWLYGPISLNTQISSQFKKLSSSLIKHDYTYTPDVDRVIVEFALNKTNIDQSVFAADYIVEKKYDLVTVHRMSKTLIYLEPSLIALSKSIENLFKISNDLKSSQDLFIGFPDLSNNINFNNRFFSHL